MAGAAWLGGARHGWQARRGAAWPGMARRGGLAGEAWRGTAGRGPARMVGRQTKDKHSLIAERKP